MVVGFLCHKVVLNLLRDNHLTADTRPFFPMIYDFSFELNERDLDNKMNVDTLMKKGWVNYLKPLEITKSHQEFKIQIELPNFTNSVNQTLRSGYKHDFHTFKDVCINLIVKKNKNACI